MKSINRSVKILFVSALGVVPELAIMFPDVKRDEILRKPVSTEEFINSVKTSTGDILFIVLFLHETYLFIDTRSHKRKCTEREFVTLTQFYIVFIFLTEIIISLIISVLLIGFKKWILI